MKRWPLRWKIALYAAGFGIVATIAGAATTWTIMHFSEMAAFDQKIKNEANEIFSQVEKVTQSPERNESIKTRLLALHTRDRVIELDGADGEVLFVSPALGKSILNDGETGVHTRDLDGRKLRISTFQQNGLTLYLGGDLSEINKIGRDIFWGMFGAIPTVLTVVAIGGRWVARQALGPVEAIRQAAAEISPQRLDQRLPVPPAQDEIAGLVSVLNNTFERLQRSFEQSIRFSADASHHLKTPLAVLRAGVEEILTDPKSTSTQQVRANALLDQIRHLTSVSENLLLLARADAGRLELRRDAFDLREVLDGACDDMRALAEPQGITVETDMPEKLPIVADRFAVELIVQNLIDNAIKYNQVGGCVRLTAQAANRKIEIKIANKGEAIPSERAAHIFERFYRARTDQRAGGQGLGLSIARELADAQQGELVLVSSTTEWTEFKFTLPGLQPG
jgi:signal transduction histidine kinase